MFRRLSRHGCSGALRAFWSRPSQTPVAWPRPWARVRRQQLPHLGAPAQACCIRTRSPGDLGHIKVGERSDAPQNYHLQVPPARPLLGSSLPFQALYLITDGFTEGFQVHSTPWHPLFITDIQ